MSEVAVISQRINHAEIEAMAEALSKLRGRLHIIGLGGSLSNAVHMAADLRKICMIDAVSPNISEMTANMNDEGLSAAFCTVGATVNDALFVLSVGGGTEEVSTAITRQIRNAIAAGVPIYGIVGPNGGETAKHASICIRVPVDNANHVTPHTEAFQAVIWHCLVSHPLLQKRATKW